LATTRKPGSLAVYRSYRDLDRVIKSNTKAAYAFALALYEMRESGAYKEKYGTFEDYCQKELGHPRSWANRQIVAHDFGSSDDPKSALFSTGESEWPTPPHIIAATVETLGTIDLDPCASEAGRVPAAAFHTVDDDGLAQPWTGRVYMNPPYGRVIGDWTSKLAAEYAAGNVTSFVALVPARTDTEWFQDLADSTLCFIRGRLRFGDAGAGAPFPSVAAYSGPNRDAFVAAFSPHGAIWERVR
jgi:phage N-6-adenine-methyltransferase